MTALIRSAYLSGKRAIGEELPQFARLWNEKRVVVPRRLKWMIEAWRGNAILRKESEQAFAAYQGGDMIDVGAFQGWYAFLLGPKATRDARFVLCEPDTSRALPCLYANLAYLSRLFPHVRFTVLPLPIGDGTSASPSQPGVTEGHERWAHDRQAIARGNAGLQSIRVDDLVSLLHLRPEFLKIDVEGAEYDVIAGSHTTLGRYRPTVCLELHPKWLPIGVEPAAIESALEEAGYRVEYRLADSLCERQLWRRENP